MIYNVMDLHDALFVPNERVSVEGLCGVKPEMELLFSVAFSLAKHICV